MNNTQETKNVQPAVYSAINNVTAALAATGISKDRKNAQQGYSFRGIDDIFNALSRLLAENKLCIIPRVQNRTATEGETKNGGRICYVAVDVEFDLVSAIDGSKHTAKTYGEAMDSADKATNKAMSAAYKYMALQLFAIPTEGDNDADASHHEVNPVARQAEREAAAAKHQTPTRWQDYEIKGGSFKGLRLGELNAVNRSDIIAKTEEAKKAGKHIATDLLDAVAAMQAETATA